jgi:hypothetical protein
MALEPQATTVPFAQGLDEGANQEGSPNGFLTLQNCVWRDRDSFQRRNGFVRVGDFSGNTKYRHAAMVSGNSLLVNNQVFNPNTGLSDLPTGQSVIPVQHQSFGTWWTGKSVMMADAAASPAYVCAAALEAIEVPAGSSNRTASWIVRDRTTGAQILSGTVSSNVCAIRVLWAGADIFHVFYVQGAFSPTAANLTVIVIHAATLSVGAPVVLDAAATCLSDEASLDAAYHAASGTLYVAYSQGASLALQRINAGTTTIIGSIVDAASPSAGGGLSVDRTAAGVAVVYAAGHGNASGSLFTTTLSAKIRATATPVFAANTDNIGVVADPAGGNTLYAVGNLPGTDSVATALWDTNTTTVTAISTFPMARAISKPIGAAPLALTVPIAFGIVPDSAAASGFAEALLVTINTGRTLAVLAFDEVAATFGPGLSSGGLEAIALPVTEEAGVSRVRITSLTVGTSNTSPSLGYGTVAQLLGDAFISGSLPQVYDGAAVIPAAFVAAPDRPSAIASAGTSSWTYIQINEYTDAQGNVQLSPLSLPVSVGPTAGLPVTVTVSAPFSRATLPATTVLRINLYRTQNGGATFNRIATWVSDGTSQNYVDNNSDASILGNPVPYTTPNGAVLESGLAAPVSYLTAHKNRLFGIRGDSGNDIVFTAEITEGTLPKWSDILDQRVDNGYGPAFALASLDDKLLIFQANRISVITGPGPDALGAGSFNLPEVVASGVGVDANNARSVVETPYGVIFRHSSGVYLIARDLSVTQIGLPVQRLLDGYTVQAGRFLPALNQTWLMLRTAQTILVFDHTYSRWSQFTSTVYDTVITDAIEVSGVAYLVTDAGLYKYDTTTYVDKHDGVTPTYFAQVVDMPWFRGAGYGGSMRGWRIGLHGRKGTNGFSAFGPGTVTLAVYTQQTSRRATKDATVPDATFTWSAAQMLALTPNDGFHLSARVTTQRCDAMRCKITVTPLDVDAVLALSAVDYIYGQEPSKEKSPAGRRPTAA